MSDIPQFESIAPLQTTADIWFVDIWGVMHNGVRPFDSAIAACLSFRDAGGHVVLVSNSPRPREGVITQLDHIGVDRQCYDEVITSGDVSRRLIAALPSPRIVHLGPDRDVAIFHGLTVTRVADEEADAIVCTGLIDDEAETVADYADRLRRLAQRDLPMICANPDLAVERGGRLIPCAGAVAQSYAELGGAVMYAGKPHQPIYDAAMEIAGRLRGEAVDRSRVLAIGDGAMTDIAGAARYGVRSVFIASGVHVRRGETVSEAARRLFPDAERAPIATMTALA